CSKGSSASDPGRATHLPHRRTFHDQRTSEGGAMRVHEVMTEPPQTCPRTMHLADASRRMRDSGCGSLVVLGARGRVVGIVTDRDLALALGKHRDAGRLSLDRVMTQPVHICR